MLLNPIYPTLDMLIFQEHDWCDFYGDAKEAIPPNATEPRGKDTDLIIFFDSDHAGYKLTRRSITGYIIFLNNATIAWFYKKQATIETSVFGAEFVAMKIGMKTLWGLRYKLCMMGVPISGPYLISGGNMSVIHNTHRPESISKKKLNSICYHVIRESVAMQECLTGHVPSVENLKDICTKVVPGGANWKHLIGKVLNDLYEQ